MIHLRMLLQENGGATKVQDTYKEGKIFHLPQDLFHLLFLLCLLLLWVDVDLLLHDYDKEEEEVEEEDEEDEEEEEVQGNHNNGKISNLL